MSALTFERLASRRCAGFKGPMAPQWLAERALNVPASPNSWESSSGAGESSSGASASNSGAWAASSDDVLIARLGAAEFFLDAEPAAIESLASSPAHAHPEGVYPVLREDAAFLLCGDGALDVLAQICSVDFAGVPWDRREVIMTLMIGVAVLVVPQKSNGEARYRIWCDPTYGEYLEESVGRVVVDCGGWVTGEAE